MESVVEVVKSFVEPVALTAAELELELESASSASACSGSGSSLLTILNCDEFLTTSWSPRLAVIMLPLRAMTSYGLEENGGVSLFRRFCLIRT